MAHIRKRGKTYSYTIDTGINPITGKRNQVSKGGFIRKKDAEAAARRIELEIDENRYVQPSKEIFSVYVKEWFNNHYKNRIKETTVKNREYTIEKHLIRNNPFVDKEIAKITTADIDGFYNLKMNEEYSASYIRKMHQLLNLAFEQAVKWNKIATNPVVNTDPPAVRAAELSIWSYKDIHSFLNTSRGERHYLTFLLAIYTGMRRGEILGLKWIDINFVRMTIQVSRSLAYIPGRGYILTSPKTKKSIRQIPLPQFVINELLLHKKKQDEWRELVGTLYEDQGLVISTNIGSVQDPQNVNRVMKRLIKKANVTMIRFHDIRHTHASILISEGVDIVKISSRLGHANPKITYEFYAHLIPNTSSDVADIFHSAILNNTEETFDCGQIADNQYTKRPLGLEPKDLF